jgi:hypothetical protein
MALGVCGSDRCQLFATPSARPAAGGRTLCTIGWCTRRTTCRATQQREQPGAGGDGSRTAMPPPA